MAISPVNSHGHDIVRTSGNTDVFPAEPSLAIHSNISLRPRAIGEFGRSWRILCCALLGMLLCCLPGSLVGVSIDLWSRDFGWSLSSIGSLALFGGAAAAATGPRVGRLMDRIGARRIILAYVPLWALSVAATSLIGKNIWTLYLLALVQGCVATGFAAYTRAITVWFDAGRGTALGFICLGVGLSGIIGPPLAQWIVDDYGWRMGHRILAGLVLLAWPLAFFWLHEPKKAPVSVSKTSHSCPEAVKTVVFWLLGGSFLLWGLTGGGELFLMPFLTTQGMSRADAASCIAMAGVTTVIGLPLFGIIIDRLHAPFVAAAALLVSASAFIILALLGGQYATLAVSMIGLAGSAWMSCLDYSTARYFGLRAFNEISGLIDRMAIIGGMIGPLIFSLLRDASGNYTVPYVIVGILGAGSALCMAMAGRHPFSDVSTVIGASKVVSLEMKKGGMDLYAEKSSGRTHNSR